MPYIRAKAEAREEGRVEGIEEGKVLGLEEGSPALEVEDYVHLSNGQLFNVSRIVYNYKTTHFYASNVD